MVVRSFWPTVSRRLAVALLLFIGMPTATHAEADGGREAKIKAAVVFKTIKFVEWPEKAFSSPKAPLGVCLFGESPLVDALRLTDGVEAQGHSLQFRQSPYAKVRAEGCQVAFVAQSEAGRLTQILNDLANKPVLLISDIDGFAQQGGAIGLVQADNKLRFEVNLKAARQAGLNLSAPLLELATVVE